MSKMHSKIITSLNELPRAIQRLSILDANDPNAVLGLLSHGSVYSFQYTQDNNRVSLAMKPRVDPYNSGAMHSCFSQNLPEGYLRHYIYERMQRTIKDAKINDMFLLGLIGSNGVGSIGYDAGFSIQKPQAVALNELLNWEHTEPIFPHLLDKFYLSGMTSGMQPKVLIDAIKDNLAVKANAIEGNYIVKSYDPEFPHLTVNEYVCMQAASYCGLDVPNTYLSADKQIFVIERFDIDNTTHLKLGLDDFVTLIAPSGADKYQGSYSTILKAVQLYTQSSNELAKAFKYVVFNCLIGNGDAHLKNFALMYERHSNGTHSVRLSPLYDVTHTLIYKHLSPTLALKIESQRAFPNRDTLIKLGKGFSISNPSDIIDEFASKINDYLDSSVYCKDWPELCQSIRDSVSVGSVHSSGLTKANRHRILKYPNE